MSQSMNVKNTHTVALLFNKETGYSISSLDINQPLFHVNVIWTAIMSDDEIIHLVKQLEITLRNEKIR